MKLLQKLKQRISDKKFSKQLGEKARLNNIEVRSYQEEMQKLMEKRIIKKAKLKAKKHISSWYRRYKFSQLTLQDG